MGSKWRKFKHAIGSNTCVHLPKTLSSSSSSSSSDRLSSSVNVSENRPASPTPASSGLRVPKSKSSQGTCAICLKTMKPGQGNAIFTAECSHSFHFHCITSNVKHGNKICPVCRAQWKEVPFPPKVSHDTSQSRDPSSRQVGMDQLNSLLYNISEPAIFDDDELLEQETSITPHINEVDSNITNTMEIITYPELSAIRKSVSHDNFNVLIHLKAPPHSSNNIESSVNNSRAPVDLVTVLDISGSMAGSKIELLKQAMSFVIQNLSSSDRLSVVVFSSTARRIIPLLRMDDSGQQQALNAVNSLVSNGGTNIAEGLKKGVKVFVDRKWKNPVGSIMLLSDGQDTYNVGNNRTSIVPDSIQRNSISEGLKIPVHAFGFGVDHDATLMHSISEVSGGTFSFIEAENVIQDAFAQCIGGLLSVVVQELQVQVQCVHPLLQLSSVKAGSYQSSLSTDARMASIMVGDLYAEEERNFLVTLDIPVDRKSGDEMSLLMVRGLYNDPLTKQVGLDIYSEVAIERPKVARDLVVSVEVDRQRNRLKAAEAMSEARDKAERGDLSAAISVLERCYKALSETVSARASDPLCAALSAELKEMQERMANQYTYEQSGRAYVLSGLSSHSWQRATARGDSTNTTSFVHGYQTPAMVTMVSHSQILLGGPQTEIIPRCSRSCVMVPKK